MKMGLRTKTAAPSVFFFPTNLNQALSAWGEGKAGVEDWRAV